MKTNNGKAHVKRPKIQRLSNSDRFRRNRIFMNFHEEKKEAKGIKDRAALKILTMFISLKGINE